MALAVETTGVKRRAKPGKAPAVDRDTLLRAYRDMLLIRRFEEKAGQLYGMGLIGGFCHLYIGQEAVGTGVMSELRHDDYVITTYRDHGQALARNQKIDQGIVALQKALVMAPTDANVIRALGAVLAQAGRAQESEALLARLAPEDRDCSLGC